MIQGLVDIVNTVLGWLPTSPFADIELNIYRGYIGWLAWFLPIHQMLVVMYAWIGAIAVYYLASIMLRWVKAIQ